MTNGSVGKMYLAFALGANLGNRGRGRDNRTMAARTTLSVGAGPGCE